MTSIVDIYLCQIEPEIRAFSFEEVQYSISINPDPYILLTTNIFAKAVKQRTIGPVNTHLIFGTRFH